MTGVVQVTGVRIATVKPRKPIPKISKKQIARQKILNEIRHRWWNEGKRTCGICKKEITDFNNYILDHILPRKMGRSANICGTDSESNLQPSHGYPCNTLKGSRRNFSLYTWTM